MTTKEKINKTLDELPDALLEQVYEFINSIKSQNSKDSKKKRVRTFKLKGQFDNVNIRQSAYE